MKKRKSIIIIIILFFVSTAVFGYLEPAGAGAFSIFRPLFLFSDATGRFVGALTSTLFRIPYNSEEVRALREETAFLKAVLANNTELERENMLLREMAGRSTEKSVYVFARVIARSFDGISDYIILDTGSDNGIVNGHPVLVRGMMHLGYIEEVSQKSARVRLLSRLGEKQEVYLPESSVSSVAVGEGLGAIVLQIPDSISVSEGDPIFSSGKRDYFVGQVEAVSQSDEGPFQIVKTGLPLSVRDIRNVFVILE
jgi:cell shape-determining protein MreC